MSIDKKNGKRPHPVDVAVGANLKTFRTLRRMSQGDVAKLLGLSFQQIQKYEIGTNRIAASRLFSLANVLDVSVADFFQGINSDAGSDVENDDQGDIVRMIASILKPLDAKKRTKVLRDIKKMEKSHE